MSEEPIRDDAVRCPVTNRWIREEDPAKWCAEIGKWISEKGEKIVLEAFDKRELDKNPLYGIIMADWQARDEDQSGYYY